MNKQERTVRNDRIKSLRLQGHSNSQIAQEMGMKEGTVALITREMGLSYVKLQEETRVCEWCGKEFITEKHTNKKFCCSKCERANARTTPTDDSHVNDMIHKYTSEWDYVRGYTNSDGKAVFKHIVCGHETEKSLITIRKRRNLLCSYCEEQKRLSRKEDKIRKIELERQRKEWDREKEKRFKQISFSICECCGGMFYPKRKGLKYCSPDCMTKTNNAIQKDRRLQKIKDVIVDRGITLERLYDRDGGVCKLCGNVCDWSDCETREDGTFIAHNRYPSIDHVVPLSKGGMHSWSNVQLACRWCNTKKSNGFTSPRVGLAGHQLKTDRKSVV